MRTLRIALAQIDLWVGDISGNTRHIISTIEKARSAGADLVVFPELAVTGYPPEDLLLQAQFVEENQAALAEVARKCIGLAAVVGYVCRGSGVKRNVSGPSVVAADGGVLYNAAAILANRRCLATYRKQFLLNYGVFDEGRYFHPGPSLLHFSLRGVTVGVSIGEDIRFSDDPIRSRAMSGADVIVNISAFPFHIGKSHTREQMLVTCARKTGVIVTDTNMVGGQDELIFDGHSVIVDRDGEILARAKTFEEDLLVADLKVESVKRSRAVWGRKERGTGQAAGSIKRVVIRMPAQGGRRQHVHPRLEPSLDELEAVYKGLVLGVRDYVRKNGFTKIVIGLSGGIDSALTAAIAVDAVGADKVLGVFMPSPFTSEKSAEDVAELSNRLAIECRTIPITALYDGYLRSLAEAFQGQPLDTTEENIQARIRGTILMAVSNKFGHMVLTTGNKSEMSVGYATLYGDMAGGFAAIKDVPKTMVYELARLRNRQSAVSVIPERILNRPPTAELRPNQKDEDNLPPYSVLDPILKAYVEGHCSVEDIVSLGYERETVTRIVGLVDRSEYKRRQAPVGIKITPCGLGKDRRMPVTNGYKHPEERPDSERSAIRR